MKNIIFEKFGQLSSVFGGGAPWALSFYNRHSSVRREWVRKNKSLEPFAEYDNWEDEFIFQIATFLEREI